MKRKMVFVKGAAAVLAGVFLAACGKADPGQEVPLQSNDDQDHEEIVSQMMADVVTYKSKDGWSVQYHTEQFDMEEDGDSVKFIYREGTPGANTEEIRYIKGKQPQEVLGELTDIIKMAWSNKINIEKTKKYLSVGIGERVKKFLSSDIEN